MKFDKYRLNSDITASQVRLIGADGSMVGVVNKSFALTQAKELGLDLVEIAPQASPPVCKILNYSKFRYAEQKRKQEMRKNQKVVELKEIQVSVRIDDHDFAVKFKNAQRFLSAGHKVKVVLRFWGREMAHQDLGRRVLQRFQEAIESASLGKVDSVPSMEGRRLFLIMAPIAPDKK